MGRCGDHRQRRRPLSGAAGSSEAAAKEALTHFDFLSLVAALVVKVARTRPPREKVGRGRHTSLRF
jgi:hypothetical protein